MRAAAAGPTPSCEGEAKTVAGAVAFFALAFFISKKEFLCQAHEYVNAENENN